MENSTSINFNDALLLRFYPVAKVAIVIAWIAILGSMYFAYNLYSEHAVYESASEALFNPLRISILVFLTSVSVLHVFAGRRYKKLSSSEQKSVNP
jgi:hypothetical protein